VRRIRELEREIMSLRSRHTEKIQELKTAFLREKRECEISAEKKIADMSKQASQVMSICVVLVLCFISHQHNIISILDIQNCVKLSTC